MIFSIALVSAILIALLGNILVLCIWRKKNAVFSRDLALSSCVALAVSIIFAFDLFTQIWAARPETISGHILIGSVIAFLCLSIAAMATLVAHWLKHRHAAA